MANGMDPASQRLIYKARPLQDNVKLSDYGKCNIFWGLTLSTFSDRERPGNPLGC